MKHFGVGPKGKDQPEFLKPKTVTLVDAIIEFKSLTFWKKMVFLELNNSFYLAPSAKISIFFIISNIRLYLQAISELHFAAKWSKMTFKKFHFYQN